MRAGLVTYPVGIRIPKWTRIEGDDLPVFACQALSKDAASGAAADHDEVNLLLVVESAHLVTKLVIGACAVIGQEPG